MGCMCHVLAEDLHQRAIETQKLIPSSTEGVYAKDHT